jgi:hypothetical protein
MTPHFEGLRVLDAFLASVQVNQISNTDSSTKSVQTQVLQFPGLKENKMSCIICNIPIFGTLDEFKNHRQSEEHLNKLTNLLSLSNETDEENNQEYLDESIKGSPYFEISHIDSKIQCYKIILAERKEALYSESSLDLNMNILNRLKTFQKSSICIALNGGGYFAAAIFDNSAKQLVCSKTFRRYTTRRKQGGSQSLKDNEKGGKIHSVGAMIRRENEKKLRDEILNLIFSTWKPQMSNCSLIFCNRDSFLTQKVFKDMLIRTLPFTTYQADSEEICRCYNELISSIKTLE